MERFLDCFLKTLLRKLMARKKLNVRLRVTFYKANEVYTSRKGEIPIRCFLSSSSRGHGFKSRTGLNLFQALFSLLPK